MKLPDGDRARIDFRKIVDYCLNPDHEEGQHKARLFRERLGLTRDDAALLMAILWRAAVEGEAIPGKVDGYGQRYTIDFPFSGPAGTKTIRSAWIIGPDEPLPRLVTCFILQP